MQFLCLAYGAEEDWIKLSRDEQDLLLSQDEVLRRRGDLVAAVGSSTTTVRAWDGRPTVSDGPVTVSPRPLAGFSIIEAADVEEVLDLVAQTPCARAGGMIEVRPITASNGSSPPVP